MLPIYEKIDFLLKLNHLKQNNMCEAIKIPTSTYSSMKQRNSKSISIDTIRDIYSFCNISIDYFLNEDNKTLVLTLINSLIEIQNKDTP